jgi:DUF4097 and DUF4098 domain-containing protein YvlB
MRMIKTALVVMALTFLAVPAAAETMEREFRARPGGVLEFDLETGGGIEITGWDRDAVSITADLRGRDRGDADVTMESTSDGVRIASEFRQRRRSRSTEFRFEVMVPRTYDIRIDSAGGGVSVTGVEGKISGETAGGALELREIRGELSLETMGGEITLEDVEADGSVSTMGGQLDLTEVTGDLEVKTMGGQVDLRDVYGNVKASTMGGAISHTSSGHGRADTAVRLSTMGGSITVGEAPLGADLETMGGSIKVRSAGNFVKAETMGGSIEIKEIDGWVRAKTMGGEVFVRLVDGPAGDRRDVELSSMGGDIELIVPPDFSMDVDIELAYTKNSSGDYSIISDFDLDITRTREWEYEGRGRRGTPRKYIYGRGNVRGGNHTVKIHTINGDVRLSRGD